MAGPATPGRDFRLPDDDQLSSSSSKEARGFSRYVLPKQKSWVVIFRLTAHASFRILLYNSASFGKSVIRITQDR